MAARPKRESRPPKRFIDEVEQPKPCAMKKKPKKDNNLYDIEVIGVDKEKKCMKIHFIGLMEVNLMSSVISISTVISYHLSALKNLCSRRRIVRRQKGNVSRQFISSD